MPAYDYRCTVCGCELEILHRIQETITERPHEHAETGEACGGRLERLISLVGVNQTVGSRPLNDAQIARAGFSKYVKTKTGYEKAAGPPNSPNLIRRD